MSSDEETTAVADVEYDSAQDDVSVHSSDEAEAPEEDADAADADPDYDAPVSKYASVVRIVHPDDRMTSEIMSLYEQAECTGIRAQQIATYNNCMVACDLADPIEMAKYELMQRKCPLVIRRKVGEVREGEAYVEYYEEWNPNEMTFAVDYD